MTVQTRLFTNHTVTVPGSQLRAEMMLDDHGHGNITLATETGPVLTVDAVKAESIAELLAECIATRDLMTLSGTTMLADDSGSSAAA